MKKFLMFLISIFQSVIGFVIINQFSQFTAGGPLRLGLILFLLIIEFAFGALVTFKLREYEVLLPLILEIILCPVAVFRVILGSILAGSAEREFALEHRSDELLGNVAEYLLYFELSDEASISKTGNFVSIFLLALPVSFIMFYSFWNDIFICDWALANFNMKLPRYNIIIGILINLFLTGALCVIRSQEVEYESYNANYKFENIYTGKKEKRYSPDYTLTLTKKSSDHGWKHVSGGYESHFTIEMILTIILSPILFFTYLVGVLASIVSIFVPAIFPCIGQTDFDNLPGGPFQRILHFLFLFVIDPEKAWDKKEEKEKLKKKKALQNQKSKPVSTTKKIPYYKPKQKQKLTFKEILYAIGSTLAWPFIKIWEGIKALGSYLRDKFDSFGEFMVCLLKVIFFPIILIYKLIKAIVVYIGEHCDSIGAFLFVLLQIIFFPITLIVKLLKWMFGGDASDEFKATIIITFLAAGLAGLYYLMGKTAFIEKVAFDIGMSWILNIFTKFFFTKMVAGWFSGAGIFCIVLAVLIAIVAVIEVILIIAAFIIGLICMILAVILQFAIILIIPAGLVIFALVIYLKNFAETEAFGKILGLIFIIVCTVFVVLYAKALIPLMFPN